MRSRARLVLAQRGRARRALSPTCPPSTTAHRVTTLTPACPSLSLEISLARPPPRSSLAQSLARDFPPADTSFAIESYLRVTSLQRVPALCQHQQQTGGFKSTQQCLIRLPRLLPRALLAVPSANLLPTQRSRRTRAISRPTKPIHLALSVRLNKLAVPLSCRMKMRRTFTSCLIK